MMTEDEPAGAGTRGFDATAAFEAERAHSIGSTDSPAILGLSRWGSMLTVWRRLTGREERRSSSLPAWIGTRIEGVVDEMYRTSTGNPTRADNLWHPHPTMPGIGCHIDRRVVGEPIVVELKTRAGTRGFGDDGSSAVPPDIFCQVQHQMMCLPAVREVHVAVLFGLGFDFRVLRVQRDPEFIAELERALAEFQAVYLETGVEPPAGATEADAEAVKVEQEGEGVLSATPEQAEALAGLRAAARVYAAAAYDLAREKNRAVQMIGTAAGIVGPFGVVTNKEQAGRPAHARIAEEYKAALAGALAAWDAPLDPSAPLAIEQARNTLETAAARNTGRPFRVLRMQWSDEQEEEGE